MRPAAFALAAACLGAIPCFAADCTGPAALQAQIAARPNAQSYADLGAWFGEKHDFRCAVDALQAGLRLDPDSKRLNYLLGLTLFSAGQTEESLGPLKRSSEMDPKALEPHILLGSALGQLQHNPEARVQWQAALRIDPGSTVALDGMSRSLNSTGEYAATIELLRPVKRNEDLTIDLAFAYGKGGMLQRSNETLQAALRVNPSSTRLTDALATVLVEQHKSDEAVALLKKSLKLHPNDLDGERIYIPLLVFSGEFSAAEPMAVKLLALDPHDFQLLLLNGIIEHQVGRYQEARVHLEQSIALEPKDSSAHYYLGLTCIGLDDMKGARAELEKAVELNPANGEAHFQLANILRDLGETTLAQEQSKIAQQSFKAHAQHVAAEPRAKEAAKKLAAGDVKAAVALYREACQDDPQDAQIAYQLALALDKAGDTEAERTTLEQILQSDPSMAQAQNQYGYLLSRSGNIPDAEAHFHLAVQSAPAYAEAWVNYAAALAVQSRFEDANKALAQALRLEPANARALGLKRDLAASNPTGHGGGTN